jgi:hypothetical protein
MTIGRLALQNLAQAAGATDEEGFDTERFSKGTGIFPFGHALSSVAAKH